MLEFRTLGALTHLTKKRGFSFFVVLVATSMGDLEAVQEQILARLNDLNTNMNARFNDINANMNGRFNEVNLRFNTQMQLTIGMWVTTIFAFVGAIVTIVLRT